MRKNIVVFIMGLGLFTALALAQTPTPAYFVYLPLILKGTAATVPSPTGSVTVMPNPALTFYVAPQGNDQATGSLDQPWRTLQKAAASVSAGSTVYVRGGVYAETVTFKVSGSAEKGYITFRNYPNETPIIDGATLTVSQSNTALLMIESQSYLIIQGFELRNYKSASTDQVPTGIMVRGSSHHVELRNNYLHHIETTAATEAANAHGLAIYGTVGNQSLHDITVDGNELAHLKLGSSEAMVVNGNVEAFTITRNLVHDNNNIGIDIIGFEGTSPNAATDQARQGVIRQNTVYNIDTLTNPAYHGARSAGGIYVDGGTQIVIEQNLVHDNNLGIELASEHAGGATTFITVRNNIVYHNHSVGISLGGYDSQRGQTADCVVVNNSFYQNDADQTGAGELSLSFDTLRNVIKNNIFVANEAGIFMMNEFTQNKDNILNYNLFYTSGATPTWGWKQQTYTSLAAYQAATGNESQGQLREPKWVNPAQADFHLTATSPALDAGENLVASGNFDFEGEPRLQGARLDIGADELP